MDQHQPAQVGADEIDAWETDVAADYHNNVDDADDIDDLKNAVENIFDDDGEVNSI